jgi:hypothetical protein
MPCLRHSTVVIGTPVVLCVTLLIARRYSWLDGRTLFWKRAAILFASYRDDRYYWEVIAIVRRSLLVGISVSLWDTPHYHDKAIMLFCLTTLLLQVWGQPWRTPLDNLIETALQVTLSLSAVFFVLLRLIHATTYRCTGHTNCNCGAGSS